MPLNLPNGIFFLMKLSSLFMENLLDMHDDMLLANLIYSTTYAENEIFHLLD